MRHFHVNQEICLENKLPKSIDADTCNISTIQFFNEKIGFSQEIKWGRMVSLIRSNSHSSIRIKRNG